MDKYKLILLEDKEDFLVKKIKNNKHIDLDIDYTSDINNLLFKIHKYDGIIIRSRFVINKHFLQSAKKLKFIARIGAGLENIDLEYAKKNNIKVINSPEGNKDSVGEFVLGLILCLLRKINSSNYEILNNKWSRESNRGLELGNKIVGVLGYGNMGKSVAKKIHKLSKRTIFYDILNIPSDKYAEKVNLDTFFENVDILTIHIPENDFNKNFLNNSFINSFKKNIYIVNTSRGKLLSLDVLIHNFKINKVIGAALDVIEYESHNNYVDLKNINDKNIKYLKENKNIILTPHIAGLTFESKYKLALYIYKKIKYILNI